MRRVTKYGAVAILTVSLQVAPAWAKPSDPWITAKTKIALLTESGVSSGINVDTVDGIVTLHGTVNSPEEKARAEQTARKIDGVREVRNLLQVVPARHEKAVSASDKEIKDHVAKALKDDPALHGSDIDVQSVNNGVVLLSGKADSVSDHLRAIQDAYAVTGVRKVESEVQSPDRLADAEIRRRESPSKTAGTGRGIGEASRDMWITTDAKMRLLADSRTPATDIDVDTRNGIVELWGTAPSNAAKSAAEEDVRKVSGVKRVVNHLQVVPNSKKEVVEARDDDLQKQVTRALEKRDDLQGANIDVDVKNGVARLKGTVEDEQQRLAAAITARSTPGVRAVQDDLRVSAASK